MKYYWSKLPCSRTRHKYPGAESHPLSQSPVITSSSSPPTLLIPNPPPPLFTERQTLPNLNENKLVYLFGTCFMNEKSLDPRRRLRANGLSTFIVTSYRRKNIILPDWVDNMVNTGKYFMHDLKGWIFALTW